MPRSALRKLHAELKQVQRPLAREVVYPNRVFRTDGFANTGDGYAGLRSPQSESHVESPPSKIKCDGFFPRLSQTVTPPVTFILFNLLLNAL